MDLRSSLFMVRAERTLVQLSESIISLQILPLIKQVKRKRKVRNQDSCDEQGNTQFQKEPKFEDPYLQQYARCINLMASRNHSHKVGILIKQSSLILMWACGLSVFVFPHEKNI